MSHAPAYPSARRARRIPGLTPSQQESLVDRVRAGARAKARAGMSVDAVVDLVLAEADAALAAALPVLPPASALTVRRMQGFSDTLRAEGRTGLARDVDILAGMLQDLARP